MSNPPRFALMRLSISRLVFATLTGMLAGAGGLSAVHAADPIPPLGAPAPVPTYEAEVLLRFAVPEADQGVAVDARHFYAVDNRTIAKYDKQSGRRVALWQGAADGPIIHLDSAMVWRGRLYCAHSNYPGVPMLSSIEIFDAATLEHVASHSFGIAWGSATWVDRHDEAWWVGFANYGDEGGTPGHGPQWTTLVRFDDDWRPTGAWTNPPEIVARFATPDRPGRSNSGGSWGSDGLLYITGHDRQELYGVRLPQQGSVLEFVKMIRIAPHGQGIAWDRTMSNILYGIERHADPAQVIVSYVPASALGAPQQPVRQRLQNLHQTIWLNHLPSIDQLP